MKPDINIALLNAAQEIINRFSPLIEDEYERSRLGSWGALILISAMKLNDASSSLRKENIDIVDWLNKYSNIDGKDLDTLSSFDGKSLDQYDEDNQKLRALLNSEIEKLEMLHNKDSLKQSINLMRSMHKRRSVSDLIGLLQQSEN